MYSTEFYKQMYRDLSHTDAAFKDLVVTASYKGVDLPVTLGVTSLGTKRLTFRVQVDTPVADPTTTHG